MNHKKLSDLTEADTVMAYEIGKEVMLLLKKKAPEPLVAVRALEMVACTLLHGAAEIEGRSMVQDFVTNVRELYDETTK